MKKVKLIFICLFAFAVMVIVAYISSKITAKHYREINIAEQKQNIIEKNTIMNKAKISGEH